MLLNRISTPTPTGAKHVGVARKLSHNANQWSANSMTGSPGRAVATGFIGRKRPTREGIPLQQRSEGGISVDSGFVVAMIAAIAADGVTQTSPRLRRDGLEH